MPAFEPGWVWLAGAGPGDPGLLTLQALHALEQADIIYFDALVSHEVLRLATPAAERISVGKRAGITSPRQAEITRRLVESARAGRRVLRLKGGDPMVFGRGAEEALALSKAGVPFRIVPGVTSGVGGLAYAGIALTHRDYNQSVAFVTAHDASGELSESIDWTALVRSSPVIVVYMGFRLLAAIGERLIAAGCPPSRTAAVVSNATTERQRTVVSTLECLARDVEAAVIDPPVLLVVGEIVRLRRELDWRDGWPELKAFARAARRA
jgi:uroporphyrin-III C-methyltransferase